MLYGSLMLMRPVVSDRTPAALERCGSAWSVEVPVVSFFCVVTGLFLECFMSKPNDSLFGSVLISGKRSRSSHVATR